MAKREGIYKQEFYDIEKGSDAIRLSATVWDWLAEWDKRGRGHRERIRFTKTRIKVTIQEVVDER